MTYDDAGDVIPLSQRFNQEDEDIRYSLRDTPLQDADTGDGVSGWDLFTHLDIRRFRDLVNNPNNRKKKAFQKSRNGQYIIELDNKLVYTNARFNMPSIYGVIQFNSKNETDISTARDVIYSYEGGHTTR